MTSSAAADSAAGKSAADAAHRDAFAALLTAGALPGETDGFDAAARDAAAGAVAAVAARRAAGRAAISLESAGGDAGQRVMRLAVVNDDMPFLVDSVAAAIAARGLAVHRLLHPIAAVRRDADGALAALLPAGTAGERHESIIYIEMERADARERRALADEIARVLADVRAAVEDWGAMTEALRDAATALPDGEGAALLRWFLDGNLTLLGRLREGADGTLSHALGIGRSDAAALCGPALRTAAIRWFADGGLAPLLLKSDRLATVHRRQPLDLAVLPVRVDGRVVAVDVIAGLWTSGALASRPDKVPLLRRRLADLEEELGFDPASHAGKALRHTLAVLPHDLVVSMPAAAMKRIVLTAMSLADRPRSRVVVVPDVLGRHLFAFVWLLREDFSMRRQAAIGRFLAEAAGGTVCNAAIGLDEGGLALLRYTLTGATAAATFDVAADADALDRRLREMLRGWVPAVEAALAAQAGASRAVRLALSHAAAFPPAYRDGAEPAEAARDILALTLLDGETARGARLFHVPAEPADALRLKIYRLGGLVPLSDVVPVLEDFGFVVVEERPTALDAGLGHIHEFLVKAPIGAGAALVARADVADAAIAAVLEGRAEDDAFNRLIVSLSLSPRAVVWLRAWFRYLRQAGLPYSLATTADTLTRAPEVTHGLIALFEALHDPLLADPARAEVARVQIEDGLVAVAAIDDDRILRRLHGLVEAILRTNAFADAAEEAIAFKLDSARVPGLPAPVPYREIWVYSPRIEGIHLRGGPIARGGLRWSDRRDDFRTEVLGLMKAQIVKNAVIVPTGAKGGFYPKQLPPAGPGPVDRAAWLAEGTESYRIFIRALLSVTDNIVADRVVHPDGVRVLDGDDPYFVVAADKGTATFSDIANAIAVERGFWLGDAFASGGSHGYDHKAMGITARGAWVSVTRHFAELGVDVQADPVTVAGCGDMSGDVFGNGMLLSRSLRLVAAFDHRHIFIDPAPDPASSWAERARLFALPASSWADYDSGLISAGGGVFPRTQKQITLTPQAAAILGLEPGVIAPAALIQAILRAPVDLMWFGGIGTYIKASTQAQADAGDPANDANRVDADEIRAKVIGEGANLSTTQAARIEFGLLGGRSNTDFIDNSAGVDCSDNEVNIKIALNAEMIAGTLSFEDRNALLAAMTDAVAGIVLEDNRLQTLAISAAERGGAAALPAQVSVVEALETDGRLDRAVEGLAGNDLFSRRAADGRGLTRPELAVILSHAKLALQAAIEASPLAGDQTLLPILIGAFPAAMRDGHRAAIEGHRLRREIVATRVANTVVNRLGLVAPFELAEEEGVSLARVAGAYLACDAIFDLAALFAAIEAEPMPETGRLELMDAAAAIVRLHIADLIRVADPTALPGEIAAAFGPGVRQLAAHVGDLVLAEVRDQAARLGERLTRAGAGMALVTRLVRLYELDGAVAIASLAARAGWSQLDVVTAYVRLGEALGLDWAKAAALRAPPSDPWERLLLAGLARDFEQLRLEFLARAGAEGPIALVEGWLAQHGPRVDRFARLVARARVAAAATPAMLAQIAGQARILLARRAEVERTQPRQ